MRYPENLLRSLIAGAALWLSQSATAGVPEEPTPITSPRRLPDAPPLRPTVDVVQRYAVLTDPAATRLLGPGGMLTGTPLDDNLGGNFGTDSVYGMEGNDVSIVYEGNDYLNGGSGENLLDGGAGNDTYELQGSYDIVMDGAFLQAPTGLQVVALPSPDNLDRVIARHVSVSSSSFLRVNNTLFIVSGSSTIQIDRQWQPGFTVEYFEFAEGVYSAAAVAQLAAQPGPCRSVRAC